MQKNILSSSLSLGSVEITVKDLNVMEKFYHEVMRLDIIQKTTKTITLGINKKVLLTLHHEPELDYAHPTHAGLYHFAILFSSRGDLAKMVYRILKHTPHFFSGSADHLVSEAFYFTDPEGNGIELYYDRAHSEWQWENGQIKMATLFIDPRDYLQKNIVLEEKNTEVQMGHIHLKVGNIEKAKKFYVDTLGFDVTAQLPGALFISVGGYHHHLGMNIWESDGASERKKSLGLKNFTLLLSEKKDLEALKKRLLDNSITFKEAKNSITFHDPWKNSITINIV